MRFWVVDSLLLGDLLLVRSFIVRVFTIVRSVNRLKNDLHGVQRIWRLRRGLWVIDSLLLGNWVLVRLLIVRVCIVRSVNRLEYELPGA